MKGGAKVNDKVNYLSLKLLVLIINIIKHFDLSLLSDQ